MPLKAKLLRLHLIVANQFGLDLQKLLLSIKRLPKFVRDLYQFRRLYNGPFVLNPHFGDSSQEGGDVKSEYFWQDLLVARKIFEAQPHRHVDIGSRIDGFVAHIACFRDIEVFDIRPISVSIPGVIFHQADLMADDFCSPRSIHKPGYCDSLSCLHAIEHFGLGRYGDKINPMGYLLGIQNLSKLLQEGGHLYLSSPIGRQRVEFNANWVFDPQTIVDAAKSVGLVLDEIIALDQQGEVNSLHKPNSSDLRFLASTVYRLGIFCFTKSVSATSK